MIQTGFHKLIPAHGIPERLTHDIAHAETSVYLQTMAFSPEGEPMGRICASLMEAARRGVAATLAFDEISLKTKEIGDRAETLGFCDSFREAGGTVRVLGGTGLFMTLMNRSHGKIYMADDVHYYGGGVNLTSDSFMHHDYLLRTEVPVARQALVRAATSGNPRFFLGTDSAPHARSSKETSCGCAGCYTAHAALELYAEAFEAAGALDRLEAFAIHHDARRTHGHVGNRRKGVGQGIELLVTRTQINLTVTEGDTVVERPAKRGNGPRARITLRVGDLAQDASEGRAP